jgi:hypothetical protein
VLSIKASTEIGLLASRGRRRGLKDHYQAREKDVIFGSQEDYFPDIIPTAASGGKADVNGTIIQSDAPECPLFSKADVRNAEIHEI